MDTAQQRLELLSCSRWMCLCGIECIEGLFATLLASNNDALYGLHGDVSKGLEDEGSVVRGGVGAGTVTVDEL